MVLLEHSLQKENVRILVVDEQHTEALLLDSLLSQIEGLDYELIWCSTTAKALRALATEACFDIIVIEYGLCHVGNADFLSEANSLSPATQAIVISSEMDGPLGASLIKSGATDYLVKGELDVFALERSLRYVLNLKEAHAKLGYRDHYDRLTGLVNRLLFNDRLLHAMQRAERARRKVALLTLNIDNFKHINDAYGREAGDSVIRTASERLQACVRKSDTLARNNGDEFAIILEGVKGEADLARMVTQLTETLNKAFPIPGDQVNLGCSIGVACYPQAGLNPEALLRAASLAMRHAKTERGCSYCFYTEDLRLQASGQLMLEAEFRRALRRNELRLLFQPRIQIESGEIVGIEGLIRWQHPTRGLLAPDEFIPLAEETGLVVTMGYWVIHQACLALKRLQEQGHFIRIAVNLSFRQFKDKKLQETVARIIKKTGVDARYLEFELTETAVMVDEDETRRCMDELSRLGVHFSLDDFGTGYSSFAHIQGLPISSLKIDKSFVQSSTRKSGDAVIVKAIINLAHNLDMHVIAEGVESFEQLMLLRDYECDQVQGHFYHQALPFEAVCQRLSQQASSVARTPC